jgi:pimeloyl-ACP methyl ester carboxylesterase
MRGIFIGALVTVTLATGCAAPFGVHHASPKAVHRALTGSVLSTGELSGFSEITLRRYSLMERFDDEPEAALAMLREHAIHKGDDTQNLFALAELSFFHAERSRRKPHFLAAAVYAYAYLFPAEKTQEPDPFDSRFRLACDLYNRALTEAFKSADGERVQLAAGTYALPFGTLTVDFDESQLLSGNRRLTDFVPIGELEVTGFRNRYRQPGLGAPLAAKTEPVGPKDPAASLVGPRVRVPATVLLRMEQPREQLAGTGLRGRLELHEATNEERIRINDHSVPLEMESTAALAQTLAETRPWEAELSAFLGSLLNVQRPLQLGAREPYRRGRIPVVFVHGTASSVARWADMVNDLDADPVLRNQFQFWFFAYDSGNPIGYSALVLRRALSKAIRDLDPEGQDECLRRMVVIGHSQGGLIAKITAIDSGDRFWRNVSDVPLDELHVSEETRALLREALFVKPLPFVRRVIFVATPHRGSYRAGPAIVRRLVRWLVSMPASLLQSGTDLFSRDDVRPYLKMQRLPTAIDNMSPGHPFIRAISAIPVAPGIAAHSIIGVTGNGPIENGGDGIVKYQSAHIEGVESELVVKSPHSMQSHPEVVNEVERILHLHAERNACR